MLERIYMHSPALLQNVMTTGFGIKERLLRHGGRYRAYCRELTESQWWNQADLQADQNERLRRLIAYCYEQIPYYRDLFDRLRLGPGDVRTTADLQALPILEKETVRSQPNRFLPRRAPERLVAHTTGGTTGTPLRYFATPSAIQFNYAVYEVRFRHWAGVRFGERMASMNGRVIVGMDVDEPPFWRHNPAFNQLYLSAYHLSPRNLPHYVERLQRFDPQVFVGYVSTVHAIARFMLDTGNVGTVRPRAVLVSSETLFDWMRADIEQAFQCRVFDGYSLGELVAFVSQCDAGSMHVSPEYGVVELVEIEGQHEIVATGLMNYGMPLLRYRTGDVAEPAAAGACECGRQLPRLGRIMGRIDDRIITPDGNTVGPAALSLALQDVPNLRAAQIVQDTTAGVVVRLDTTGAFTHEDEQFLLDELRKRVGHALAIEFEHVPHIPRTGAGKQRLIVSRLWKGPAPCA